MNFLKLDWKKCHFSTLSCPENLLTPPKPFYAIDEGQITGFNILASSSSKSWYRKPRAIPPRKNPERKISNTCHRRQNKPVLQPDIPDFQHTRNSKNSF